MGHHENRYALSLLNIDHRRQRPICSAALFLLRTGIRFCFNLLISWYRCEKEKLVFPNNWGRNTLSGHIDLPFNVLGLAPGNGRTAFFWQHVYRQDLASSASNHYPNRHRHRSTPEVVKRTILVIKAVILLISRDSILMNIHFFLTAKLINPVNF